MSFANQAWSALRQAASNSNSLLAKLVRLQIASLAVLVACVCGVLYVGLISLDNWEEDQVLARKHLNVSAVLASRAEQEYWLGHEVSEDMSGPRRVLVRVILSDGAIMIETPEMAEMLPANQFPALAANQRSLNSSLLGPSSRHYRVLSVRTPIETETGVNQGVVQIAIDRTLDQAVHRRFEVLMVTVAIVAIALAGLLSAFLVSRQLTPLHRMAGAIKQIEHTSLDQRVDTEGLTEELQYLGGQFNALLARLGVAYDGLKHYADNVAHEIRTPLNRMLLELDVVQQQPRGVEQYEDMTTQLAESCRELKTLVDRLLFLARATNQQAALMRSDVDLQAEIEAIGVYFEASAAEAGVAFTVAPGAPCVVSIDRTLLQRAITNLVANALSHTPAGGEVRLMLRREEPGIAIEVRDSGEGIGAEDLPHIFDRFYRADKQRAHGAGRVGLGLTIAKSIVELHGGGLAIASELHKGTTVTLTLPHAAADARALASA
jgi:two-component system, OmpR family, heavy metal sensor histidine kinase CusS